MYREKSASEKWKALYAHRENQIILENMYTFGNQLALYKDKRLYLGQMRMVPVGWDESCNLRWLPSYLNRDSASKRWNEGRGAQT